MKTAYLRTQTRKKELRLFWKEQRSTIPKARCEKAISDVFSTITDLSLQYDYILSYASFGTEFCTLKINSFLAKEGKLLLPKVCENRLKIYHADVVNLKNNDWGIPEPSSECQEADLNFQFCLLVPGLAFDANLHRLGYGKGYYDRLLSELPSEIPAYGLGFKEQYQTTPLPTTPGDRPLKDLFLF
jgi:5-formyltetrahydrofolate cyclo-ligase